MSHNLYIVDDDRAVRSSLCRLLSYSPAYTTFEYASGDAFLEHCRQLQPGVVLLDFHMDGTDGLAVLKAMRDLSDRFVIVMLTAHGGVQRSVEAMHCGAFDFLEKPYDSAKLLACLEEATAKLDAKCAATTARDAARDRLAELSPREADVLDGLLTGYSNKQIAWKLDISPRTTEIYRANMMQKLKVRSLVEALLIIFRADSERVSRQAFASAPRSGVGRRTL